MARELVGKLGLERGFKEVSEILFLLYQIFKERDATIAEINPLAMTKQGAFAADAKLSIDDDALLRQGFAREKENYVELQGSIGCIVNGAGLAMSTMDTLKYLGGEPANFLDIGGGAAKDAVKEAVEKIATHPNLKLIFVNILGGITKCDDIARGIVESRDMIKVPVVIRLRGTNEEEARALLESEGFEMVASMTKAARKAVEIAT
jgi:succinyl-CoA synthetase beta subunit